MSKEIKVNELKNESTEKVDKTKSHWWDVIEFEMVIKFIILFGGIFMLIMFISESVQFFRDLNSDDDVIVKYSISSTNYDEDIEGESLQFIIGKGSVSEKGYYVVYQILEDGGKKLLKLDAEKTIIYDNLEEGEMPYVELGKKNISGEYLQIKLYVPKGTIQEKYDLSLE